MRILENHRFGFERGFLQSYYVTFIDTGSGRWYPKQELETFQPDPPQRIEALNPRHQYALDRCERFFEPALCSLRTRLLDLSYVGEQVNFQSSRNYRVQSVFNSIMMLRCGTLLPLLLSDRIQFIPDRRRTALHVNSLAQFEGEYNQLLSELNATSCQASEIIFL